MLNQDNRLKKVRDFALLVKKGRWVNGAVFDLKYLPLLKAGEYFDLPKKEDLESFKKQLRLAVTIGLKISKSAVKRNRARRVATEVVRLLIKDQKIRPGYYLMFLGKKGVLDKNSAEISQEIKLLLKKINVLID